MPSTSRTRILTALPLLVGLSGLIAGCSYQPQSGLPPIHHDPAQTMIDPPDAPTAKVAETVTRWWLSDDNDQLAEVRRLARDMDSDLPTLNELFGDGVALSESDLVDLALMTNLDIRVSDKDRRIAIAKVIAAQGAKYDPLLAMSYRDVDAETPINRTSTQAPSSTFDRMDAVRGESRTGRVSLAQNVFTGGRVELFYSETERWDGNSEANERVSTGEAAVSLTQPLLRGFGPTVTNAQITLARYARESADQDFRQSLSTQMSSVISTYYDLIFALENAAVQRISLQQALDLLEINISRERVGDLAIVDVEQARANAASRREQYLIAVQSIYDTQDELRRLLNIDRLEQLGWSTPILPRDVPTYSDVDFSEDEQLRIAFNNRPDWLKTYSGRARLNLNIELAENNLLPQLNLTGKFGNLGAGESGTDVRDEIDDEYYDEYEVGVEFSYPLLNREARSNLRAAILESDKARYTRDALALSIRKEIRTTLRALRTNRLRVDVTLESVRAEQVKYDAELKRYDVGLSTSFQLLEFLEDLASAKVAHLQAIIDYQKSRLALETASGTLLDRVGIQIEGETMSRLLPEYVEIAPGAPYQKVDADDELVHNAINNATLEVDFQAVGPDEGAAGVEAEELPADIPAQDPSLGDDAAMTAGDLPSAAPSATSEPMGSVDDGDFETVPMDE